VNITFCDNTGNNVVSNVSLDFISHIEDPLIINPTIIDGMGERIVFCGCRFCKGNKMVQFGEIVVVEYSRTSGEKFSKTFCGNESYIIQSAIHELSLIQSCNVS